jgi:hypothetical protein
MDRTVDEWCSVSRFNSQARRERFGSLSFRDFSNQAVSRLALASLLALLFIASAFLFGPTDEAASLNVTVQSSSEMSQVDGVACPATNTCEAIGRFIGGAKDPSADGYLSYADVNASTGKITAPTVVPVGKNAPDNGIACPTSKICWIVTGPPAGSTSAVLTELLVNVGALPGGDGQPAWTPSSLSCWSATHCYYAASDGSRSGVVPVVNGTPASTVVIPGLAGSSRALAAACSGPTTCLISGTNGKGGYVALVSGSRVLDVTHLANEWLTDITCPSKSTCLGVGGTSSSPDKAVVVFINPTNASLSHQSFVTGRDLVLNTVACASNKSCVAAGRTTPAGQHPTGAYVFVTNSVVGQLETQTGVSTVDGAGCTAKSRCVLGGVSSLGAIGAVFELTLP